jgi:hypothetical protein
MVSPMPSSAQSAELSSPLNDSNKGSDMGAAQIRPVLAGELATSSSLVIATITLLLIFFIINPTPLLNSVHLITLNLFYW